MSELLNKLKQRFNIPDYEIEDTPGGVKIHGQNTLVQSVIAGLKGSGLAHSRVEGDYFQTVYIYPRGSKPELPPAQLEAIDRLRRQIPKGTTLYTAVSHVAQSGMSRTINVYLIKDNQPINIDHLVSEALQYKNVQRQGYSGVQIGGAGMDMGFAIVSHLAQKLYGDEQAIKQKWL